MMGMGLGRGVSDREGRKEEVKVKGRRGPRGEFGV